MDVGIVTRSFPHLTNAQAAELIASSGLKWVELCLSQTDSKYWVYNGRSDMSDMTDERFGQIVSEYRRRSIEVSALGVFTNMLEPDDALWQANLEYFERHLQLASAVGIPVVSTECGFIPERRGIQADRYELAFERLKAGFIWLAEKAERYDVHVALEPCVLDVVPSAKRTADFIRQVGSDRVKVLLDPANLIANNTEEEMFAHLTPNIAYYHGKDRKVNDTYGRIVGDGDIDWVAFLRLYGKHTPGTPFILEYVKEENFRMVRDRILEAAEKAGV